MGWRERYQEASFRDISFYVPSHEMAGGRRVSVHEFPGRDLPYVKDLGKSARRFSIDAYVLGENYDYTRTILLDALDEEGSGKLVHPYLGIIQAQVLTYSLSETKAELRMARLSISFIESGALVFPTPVIDTVGEVFEEKASALDKMKAAFSTAYDLALSPYTMTQNAINTINKGLDSVDYVKKTMQAVADFQRDLENIRGKVIEIAYDAEELSQNFVDLITFGGDLTGDNAITDNNAGPQFFEMEDLYIFEPDTSIGAEDPSDQIAVLIQMSACINAAGLLAAFDFTSVNEALERRDILLNKLDSLMLDVLDDQLYSALEDLRASVVNDIETRAVNLPRLVDYTPPVSVPALVLSYDLYGRVDREQEIIDRNNIQNPGVIFGGRPIEVLIDV